MSFGKLDFSTLEKAIDSFEKALARPKDEFIRDSVIQRFEYTYELAWKMLKRHLARDEGSENVDHLHRKDLFRLAGEKGIIEDVDAWFEFHEARNQTTHTYNEDTAEEVYKKARLFLPHVGRLLEELVKRENA